LEKMAYEEIMKARMELRIDAFTGKFLPKMANVEADMDRRVEGMELGKEEGVDSGRGGGIAARMAAKKGGTASPAQVNTEGGGRSEGGPSSNARSKSPHKREAAAPPEGQTAPKKSRVV
jgi:hypothetical protein